MPERTGANVAAPPAPADALPFETTESPRDRLRRVLRDRVGAVSDLTWYLEQATPRFADDAEVRLAVEELVDHLGRLLAFDAAHDEDLHCSTWISPSGYTLMAVVEHASTAGGRISALSRSREARLAAMGSERQADVTGLYILCGADGLAAVESAVIVRRAMDQVRVVTIDALVALAHLVEDGVLRHEDAVGLLRPARPSADPLIALVRRVSQTR
jgi:hypothetical protein